MIHAKQPEQVLNDMVKVKAHISELALCVHDEDPVVARMARLFFHELAQKGALSAMSRFFRSFWV